VGEGTGAAIATIAASGSGIKGFGPFDAETGARLGPLAGGVADLIGFRAGVAIIAPLNGWIYS
jgi:hypothetical protein